MAVYFLQTKSVVVIFFMLCFEICDVFNLLLTFDSELEVLNWPHGLKVDQ